MRREMSQLHRYAERGNAEAGTEKVCMVALHRQDTVSSLEDILGCCGCASGRFVDNCPAVMVRNVAHGCASSDVLLKKSYPAHEKSKAGTRIRSRAKQLRHEIV